MLEVASGFRLSVILACHNRKPKTLACLQAVIDQIGQLGSRISACRIVLVDDGSTDGTAEAVRLSFPQVQIVVADGSLFWCRSMHLAQTYAFGPDVDFLLWLNDDTDLDSDALVRVFNSYDSLLEKTGKPVALVGSLRDPVSNRATYGGLYRARWWQRTKLKLMEPGDAPLRAVSMNGNCVLLPAEIVNSVGNFDERFEHAMGDMDYGLRVIEAGYELWVMPGFVGSCGRNSTAKTYLDKSIGFRQRWKHIVSAKGLPPRSWYYFTRRHVGVFWPVYWGWPYVRLVLSALFSAFSRQRG